MFLGIVFDVNLGNLLLNQYVGKKNEAERNDNAGIVGDWDIV